MITTSKGNKKLEDLELRKELTVQRLSEIGGELKENKLFSDDYKRYFTENADRLRKLFAAYEHREERKQWSLSQLAEENLSLYEPLLQRQYEDSFFNPAYAAACFGLKEGQLYSFLQTELAGVISEAFFGDVEELLIRAELFLEVYGSCLECMEETGTMPKAEKLREIMYWFVSDYSDIEQEKRIRALVDPDCPENRYFYDLIMNSDLDDLRYLYQYGCYITENEKRTAIYLNGLTDERINLMADTFTEGYRIGFQVGNKDLSKKQTVNIRYTAGFERVIRRAIRNFENMGLKPVIYRASESIFHKKGTIKVGFCGAAVNKQLDYDHREDEALFLDGNYKTRKLETLREGYESVKELAKRHAGPACMETFGEPVFEPLDKPQAPGLSKAQQKLKVEYQQAAGTLTNEYIPGEERSFTIIAFPVPEIGDDYERIFDEIIKINTLDYHLYETIQSKLIDALNQAEYVRIKGKGANRTDLTVRLFPLDNPETQTKFENCVADVNIPVGEVFTSPVLKGTNGILHVSRVYLNELFYENLEIHFEDGMTKEVSCSNFDDAKASCSYVRENVLFHHESLPMGEFAIGTNTTAYVVSQKYGIADKLPILIAEKMGPHFAVGDTCYSHAEDVRVYNPDGKEIVAKDNEISLRRHTDPSRAYFNCHTDITIPYDELAFIEAVKKDGSKILLIRDGRFVLEGCEALNEAFEDFH